MKQACLTILAASFLLLTSCSSGYGKEENLLDSQGPEVIIPPEYRVTVTSSAQYSKSSSESSAVTAENSSSRLLDLKCIYQEPELPTGCEITSLAMVLNYFGFDVSKTELAEKYLDKDFSGKIPFDEAFMGDPSSEDGYGCFAPVIVNAAHKYLNEHDMVYSAWDISGKDFSDLYEYIDRGNPVIVWASMNLIDVEKKFIIRSADGRDVYWYDNEHCMVLCGYDKNENTVTVADPLKGMMKYNADRFEYIYDTLEKQAVIIE